MITLAISECHSIDPSKYRMLRSITVPSDMIDSVSQIFLFTRLLTIVYILFLDC